MTTPKKETIIKKAVEMWKTDQYRNGCSELAQANPEIEELRESGFLSLAQSELMRDKHRSEVEREFIDFPEHFNVNLKELFESNSLILGSRHTGKSDLAMLICERAMKQNTIIVVFDPSQDWIRRSSIKRYLKVESYTNLEIPSESLVYDLSLLSPIESQKVVERFSKRLFNYQAKIPEDKRRQYLVILEESHTYFYQGSMQSKRMQNSVKMLSVGRNVDIAVLLISQFASMLDKFAIKHSISQVWFGYTREPNDLKYLRLILGDNAEQLKKLEDGELLYLTRNGISKIAIEPFSSTIARTQIKIPEPKLIQIPEKSKTETNDFQTMAYLIVWTLFSIVALSILR